MAVLQIESGNNKGNRLKLPNRAVVVGRGDEADMRIHSSDISRAHCQLTADGEEVLVKDLGSANGTFVNGRPITDEVRMAPGDRVTFGPITLRVLSVRKSRPKAPTEAPPDSKTIDRKTLDKARKVSDDDVSSWLNEELAERSGVHEDTKILTSAAAAAIQAKREQEHVPEHVFDTVAEEAADIIRRHYESIGQAPPG